MTQISLDRLLAATRRTTASLIVHVCQVRSVSVFIGYVKQNASVQLTLLYAVGSALRPALHALVTQQLHTLFALANLWMARARLLVSSVSKPVMAA